MVIPDPASPARKTEARFLGCVLRVVLPATMPAPTAGEAGEARRTLINLRVNSAEREQLDQLAAAQGTTLSGLVRQALQSQGFKPQR